MNYKLLGELLPYIAEFEKRQEGEGVKDFLNWMQQKELDIKPQTEVPLPYKSVPLQGGVDAQICQLIALLYKYVRFYFKKGLKDTLLQTTEDFGFLATLVTMGDLRKNELIQKNTSEFTSGMEVIRRLERNELIISFLDAEDKRARKVRITEKGRLEFVNALPILKKIGAIATGRLSDLEKMRLLELLNNLNHFHNPIFHEEKDTELEKIVRDYAKK